MKKSSYLVWKVPQKIEKKLMRLSLLITLLLSCVMHTEAMAQRISIRIEPGSLDQAFQQIIKQSDAQLVYNTDVASAIRCKGAVFENQDLKKILDELLADTRLRCRLENGLYIIDDRPAEQKQAVKLIGKVVDKNGEPIVGATLVIKGTTVGVATDVDGKFEMNNLSGEKFVLQVRFIGMGMQEVTAYPDKFITITLQEEVSEMDEVVVVGYQSVRRERMTGSSKTVTAREIEGRGLTSINEVLSSTISGLNMVSSGRPGADSQIQIRGINSINGSTEPIWIVDGMPMQGELPNIKVGSTDLQSTIFTSGIGNIAPDDIKSITVLKDAAATAIYGARAANGVIVVETKSGLVGKTRFSFSLNYGIKERPRNNIEMMNTAQKIQFEKEIFYDEPGYLFEPGRIMKLLRSASYGVMSQEEADAEIARLSTIDTDWFKEIFRTATNQQYSFSMSGGTEKTQHYTSLNYQTETGTEPNNKYNKLGMSSKITHIPVEALRITGSIGATLKNDRATASMISPLNYAMYANPYERPYNEDGSYASDITYNAQQSSIRPGLDWENFNILHDLNNNTNKSRYIDAEIQLKVEWEIIKGLMFTTHGIYNVNSNHNRIVEGANTYTNFKNNWYDYISYGEDLDLALVRGSLREATAYSNAYTFKNTLQYSKDIKDRHFINFFLGQEISDRTTHSSFNYSPVYDEVHNIIGFPDLSGVSANNINFDLLGNTGKERMKMSSFFANASYSYEDRYILTGAIRYDGSDIIGNRNQFTPLWNVALRWNLHRERFMTALPWVNLFSLRGGFGYTGSIDKNALPFLVFTLGQSVIYDEQNVPTSLEYPNPNIKWQKKQDMNLGLELSLWDYRVELGVNYYHNITRDVLDKKRLASSSGRLEATTNVANLHNSGVEVDLGVTLLKRKDFQWFAKTNFAFNKNVVRNTFYQKIEDLPQKVTASSANNYVEGYAAGSWFGYKMAGVNPMTGGLLAYTGNGDATLDLGTAQGHVPNSMVRYLGQKYPPYVGGFSTSVNFRQFVFSANFEYKAGHKIMSFTTFSTLNSQNRHVNDINRWRQPGDITNVPRLSQSNLTSSYYMMDNRLEKGNYLKCGYLTLGYNLPPEFLKKIGFNTARLSFTAKDLFTLTPYKGIDPLLMGDFGYPNSRKYTITLNFSL